MKDGYTYLAVLVDRSGSMSAIRGDAEGGLKQMVAEQRALPGTIDIDLYQFDSEYEHIGPDIDGWTLQPRGTTALLDALGRSIISVGDILSAKPEDARPEKVVFLVVTDGMENASQEWTRQRVFDTVKHQEEKYGWKFVFLAANQDAIAEGGSMGIGTAMNYDSTGSSTRAMWATNSAVLSSYRSGASDYTVPEYVEDSR